MEEFLLKRKQYEIENKWSSLIKKTDDLEKKKLYLEKGYKELRKFYFDHKIISIDSDLGANEFDNMLILDLIGNNKTVMEIGFGMGNTIKFLAPFQKEIIGIESHDFALEKIKKRFYDFRNVELRVGNLLDLDFESHYFDAVYAIQVMEHLIPEEALSYLKKIHRILKEKGVIVFITCNRSTGPHDISKYFSNVAEGFHLKEYTYQELTEMLKKAGFRKIYSIIDFPNKIKKYIRLQSNFFLKIPVRFKCFLETLFIRIKPKNIRRIIFQFFRLGQIYIISSK